VHKNKLANYVEIDFPEVTSKKAMSIRKSKELSAVLGDAADIHVCEHLQRFRCRHLGSGRLSQLKEERLWMHQHIIYCLPTYAFRHL
jgi:hypothetical protein